MVGIFLLIQNRSENIRNVDDLVLKRANPRPPQNNSIHSKGADQTAHRGIIDVPGFGQISYAEHRVVRIADLMINLHIEDKLKFIVSKNTAIDVYEDSKGFLVYIGHNQGKFQSKRRDIEVLDKMKSDGINIKATDKFKLRMDDDEFLRSLLMQISTYLTSDANSQSSEIPRELEIWPVTVEFSDSYKGKEPKNIEFPSLMVRRSSGIPNDYLYTEPYASEELYLRRWLVYYYQKGDSTRESSLIDCAAGVLVEKRMDLPESGQQK